MAVIASILFLAVMAASFLTIIGSISENLPRILEVIEDRNGEARPARKITFGQVKFAGHNAIADEIKALPNLRQTASAKSAPRKASSAAGNNAPLPMAA